MIEYEVIPNNLTQPPSFSLRVRPRGTITDDTLYAEVAAEVALDTATVQAVLDGLRRVTTRHLLGGDTVHLPGIVMLSAQIAEKLLSPTQPLSDAATNGINARSDIEQINAVKNQAQFGRVESSSLAPSILVVKGLGGANLALLRAGNLIEVEGERLGITPAMPDEGAFLVPATGPAFRMTEYNAKGDKKMQFFVIGGLPANTNFSLEVRSRRSTGGTLYTTRWQGGQIHTAA